MKDNKIYKFTYVKDYDLSLLYDNEYYTVVNRFSDMKMLHRGNHIKVNRNDFTKGLFPINNIQIINWDKVKNHFLARNLLAYEMDWEDCLNWLKKTYPIISVNDIELNESDKEEIESEFAEAERALLRLVPSGEDPNAETIYNVLEFFKEKCLNIT